MKTFEEIYYSVLTVAECKYYKKTWLQQTGLSDRQFKNRLKNPTLEDAGLMCQTCNVKPEMVLAPVIEKFKNVPPYNSNLQLSI